MFVPSSLSGELPLKLTTNVMLRSKACGCIMRRSGGVILISPYGILLRYLIALKRRAVMLIVTVFAWIGAWGSREYSR